MLNLRNISLRHLAAVLTALSAMASCSVKEDRIECPALLEVHVEVEVEVAEESCKGPAVGDVLVSIFREDDPVAIVQKTIPVAEFHDNGFNAPVPRGVDLRATVVAGLRNSVITPVSKADLREQTATVPGVSDSLYSFSASANISAEVEVLTIKNSYSKDFFCVRFHFVGYEESDGKVTEHNPIGIKVKSSSNGLGIYSLDPVRKAYVMDAIEEEPSVASVIIPRQFDDSLTLELFDDEGVFGTVPFGEILRDKLDYDREEKVLKDLDIFEISNIRGNLMIKVNDWIVWSLGTITI